MYLQAGCAVPRELVAALVARRDELSDVEIVHLHAEGPAPYVVYTIWVPSALATYRMRGSIRGSIVQRVPATRRTPTKS